MERLVRRESICGLLSYEFVLVVALSVLPQFLWANESFQSLNVNSASKEQLMTLPGVGEKLAMRIVSHRDSKGQFASLDDLLLVKGLHPKLLTDLSGKVQTKAKKESAKNKEGESRGLDGVLKRFEGEPRVSQVQSKALRYASVEPARIREWLKRARIAPALPSLSFATGKAFDSGESVREKFGNPNEISKKDSSDFKVNLKVEWKFSDLLFNRNELYVARESFRMSVIRERILSDVTKTFIQRQREILKLAKGNSLPQLERIEGDLRIKELTAILDGLTGGWFSEALRNS